MIIEKLLKHKAVAKKKKPHFVRQEFHKRNKLGDTWRKPRGIHSKLRLKRRGKPQMVSIGYKMPDAVRGLTKTGLTLVLVSSIKELKALGKDCVPVMRKVSKKQRLALMIEAQKLGITFNNFKDITHKVEAINKQLTVKKEARKVKEERKKLQAEEEKKKAKMSEKQAKKGKDQPEPKLTKEQKEKIEQALADAKDQVGGMTKNIAKDLKAATKVKPEQTPVKEPVKDVPIQEKLETKEEPVKKAEPKSEPKKPATKKAPAVKKAPVKKTEANK
jgi:large subunit ribosomal protein L32e